MKTIIRSLQNVSKVLVLAAVAVGFTVMPFAPGLAPVNTAEASAVTATGGDTVYEDGTHMVHIFESDGTFEVTGGDLEVEYLIVAGGGGGGARNGGGGGAGGMLTGTTTVTSGGNSVVVGSGGTGGIAQPGEFSDSGGHKGGNSSFDGINAEGGGGGQAIFPADDPDGGSGGGQGRSGNHDPGVGISGQGHDGGSRDGQNAGAGGGGAGEAGSGVDDGSAGGDGLESDITGSSIYYAGGGAGADSGDETGGLGGGGDSGDDVGEDGEDGKGGGGGGSVSISSNGGDGGDGIVIIRYELEPELNPIDGEGNNECPAGTEGFKVDETNDLTPGTYSFGEWSVDISDVQTDEGETISFDFSNATPDLNYVVLKAGTATTSYDYQAGADSGDDLDADNDKAISHISFCWDDEEQQQEPEDNGPSFVDYELLACGETIFTATTNTQYENLYLVVDDGDNVHTETLDGSITVGPFEDDRVIHYRVFGGPERSWDIPLWNGYGEAGFSNDINNYTANEEGGDWGWVISGTDNGNPFTTWNELEVEGCPEPEEPEWCTFEGEVIEYTADEDADQNDGNPVDGDRRNVSGIENGPAAYQNVGGKEGNAWSTSDFFSLGVEGYLVYEFTSQVAFNQPGDDIAIYEITGGDDGQTDEKARVFISQDGVTYHEVETITGDGAIDIDGYGLDYVKYVKLVDDSKGIQGNNGDGYDVDAIVILDGSCGDEPKPTACEADVNLLENPSFETPVVEHPAGWNIFDSGFTGLAWVVEWLNPGGAPNPAHAELHRDVNGWVSSNDGGSQYIELDSDHNGPGDTGGSSATYIYQVIDTVPNKEYTLTYEFSPRPGEDDSENILEVVIDGNVVQTHTADGTENDNTDWGSHEYTFVATSSSVTVGFQDGGDSNSRGTFVDNTSLMCNPEEPNEEVTVIPYKVICESEEDLPNWGANGTSVDENTAQDWVDQSEESCWLEPDWDFQWKSGKIKNQTGDHELIGEKEGWSTFSGTTTIDIEEISHLSFREVLEEDYIPFTYTIEEKSNDDNESAEFYCSPNGENYDNLEWATDVEDGDVIHCVAFNAPEETKPEQCEIGYEVEFGDDTTVDGYETEGETAGAFTIREISGGYEVALRENENNDDRVAANGVITFTNADLSGATIDYDTTGNDKFEDGSGNTALDTAEIVGNTVEFDLQVTNANDVFTITGIKRDCPIPTGSIYGQKFEWPEGPGLDDWQINLFEWVEGEQSSEPVSTTSTDWEGNYEFEEVPYGDYLVCEQLEDGWTQMYPGAEISLSFIGPFPELLQNHLEVEGNGSPTQECENGTIGYLITLDDEDTTSYGNNFGNEFDDDFAQCEVTSLEIVSNEDTQVGGEDAVETYEHPNWTADDDSVFDGAEWIWESATVSDPEATTTVTFTREFTYSGNSATSSELVIATDNSYAVVLNGNVVGSDSSENNFTTDTYDSYDVSSYLQTGNNTLTITVTNWQQDNGTSESNPAGLLFKLTIDGEICPVDDDDNEEPEIETQTFGGGGGQLSSSNNNQVLGDQDEGEVLGEQTSQCEAYLKDFMHPRANNNPFEVLKLQLFLNAWMDAGLSLTQMYDAATEAAVRAFQAKYADEVLTPWGLSEPTGYVYVTTKAKINSLLCSRIQDYIPAQLVPDDDVTDQVIGGK